MRKSLLLLIVISLTLISSFNKDLLQVGETKITPAITNQPVSGIPYTDEEAIRTIGSNKDYVFLEDLIGDQTCLTLI